jgi:hypothetical protein
MSECLARLIGGELPFEEWAAAIRTTFPPRRRAQIGPGFTAPGPRSHPVGFTRRRHGSDEIFTSPENSGATLNAEPDRKE